jgi:plastocyanin
MIKRFGLALVMVAFAVFAVAAAQTARAEDGTTVEVHAFLLAFDRSSFSVPAGASVTLKLYNDENYIPHDIRVDVPSAEASKLCIGPCVSTVSFTAPDPGTYAFYCTIHPDMKGSVIVQ